MLSEQRYAGENSTHSLFKDVVALSGGIEGFFPVIKICVCVCALHAFVYLPLGFAHFSPFWNCTQTVPKVNLNLEATFSIKAATSLQMNTK